MGRRSATRSSTTPRARRCRPVPRRGSFPPPPTAARRSRASSPHPTRGARRRRAAAPTAAVQPDLVPPRSALLSARCRKRRCTVRLAAADPNSQGALRIRVTAERRVRARCGKGRKRHRCIKTRRKPFAVKHAKGTTYRATASRVPRGKAHDPGAGHGRRRQPPPAGCHPEGHRLTTSTARRRSKKSTRRGAARGALRPSAVKRRTFWAAGLSPRWPRSLRLVLRVWVKPMRRAPARARGAHEEIAASCGKTRR